jgi:hypothetical protein
LSERLLLTYTLTKDRLQWYFVIKQNKIQGSGIVAFGEVMPWSYVPVSGLLFHSGGTGASEMAELSPEVMTLLPRIFFTLYPKYPAAVIFITTRPATQPIRFSSKSLQRKKGQLHCPFSEKVFLLLMGV